MRTLLVSAVVIFMLASGSVSMASGSLGNNVVQPMEHGFGT